MLGIEKLLSREYKPKIYPPYLKGSADLPDIETSKSEYDIALSRMVRGQLGLAMKYAALSRDHTRQLRVYYGTLPIIKPTAHDGLNIVNNRSADRKHKHLGDASISEVIWAVAKYRNESLDFDQVLEIESLSEQLSQVSGRKRKKTQADLIQKYFGDAGLDNLGEDVRMVLEARNRSVAALKGAETRRRRRSMLEDFAALTPLPAIESVDPLDRRVLPEELDLPVTAQPLYEKPKGRLGFLDTATSIVKITAATATIGAVIGTSLLVSRFRR